MWRVAGGQEKKHRKMTRGRRRRSPNPHPTARVLPPPPSFSRRGHRRRGPPAVSAGCPAGSDPPGPLPIPPVQTTAPPSQAAVFSSPSVHPPRSHRGSLSAAELAKAHAEWTRPRPGPVRGRCSRCSRSRRTCSCRSSSVVPPQTPCICRVASANWRHWRRTRQAAHTSLALAISSLAGPCAATGKNSSGSASRQAADSHQSRRSAGGAPRWLGTWVTTINRPPNQYYHTLTGNALLHIGNCTYVTYLYAGTERRPSVRTDGYRRDLSRRQRYRERAKIGERLKGN
jgi:hypothetical protein